MEGRRQDERASASCGVPTLDVSDVRLEGGAGSGAVLPEKAEDMGEEAVDADEGSRWRMVRGLGRDRSMSDSCMRPARWLDVMRDSFISGGEAKLGKGTGVVGGLSTLLKTELMLLDSRRFQGSGVERDVGDDDLNCGGPANIDGRVCETFVTVGDGWSLFAEYAATEPKDPALLDEATEGLWSET